MQDFGSFHKHLADHLTVLRAACLTEAVIGNGADGPSCFFMANNQRTKNGIIPSRSFGVAELLRMADLEASVECASAEKIIMGVLPHELVHPVNRQIERAIVDALENCDAVLETDGSGAAKDVFSRCLTVLGDKEVPIEEEDNMFALVTPIMLSALRDLTEFRTSGDYVLVKRGNRQFKVWRWGGLNWLAVSSLTYSCVLHRHALGHALDLMALAGPGAVTGGIDAKTGAAWMTAKTKHLAAVLQPQGIVRIGGKQ